MLTLVISTWLPQYAGLLSRNYLTTPLLLLPRVPVPRSELFLLILTCSFRLRPRERSSRSSSLPPKFWRRWRCLKVLPSVSVLFLVVWLFHFNVWYSVIPFQTPLLLTFNKWSFVELNYAEGHCTDPQPVTSRFPGQTSADWSFDSRHYSPNRPHNACYSTQCYIG
jgi:hypothetical protein